MSDCQAYLSSQLNSFVSWFLKLYAQICCLYLAIENSSQENQVQEALNWCHICKERKKLNCTDQITRKWVTLKHFTDNSISKAKPLDRVRIDKNLISQTINSGGMQYLKGKFNFPTKNSGPMNYLIKSFNFFAKTVDWCRNLREKSTFQTRNSGLM